MPRFAGHEKGFPLGARVQKWKFLDVPGCKPQSTCDAVGDGLDRSVLKKKKTNKKGSNHSLQDQNPSVCSGFLSPSSPLRVRPTVSVSSGPVVSDKHEDDQIISKIQYKK